MQRREEKMLARSAQVGQLREWMRGESPVIPCYSFTGLDLRCSLGIPVSIYQIANTMKKPVVCVGEFGKRRFSEHVPVQLSTKRLNDAIRMPLVVTHVRVTLDHKDRPLNRPWVRDVSLDNDRPETLEAAWKPSVALLSITPAMWEGACEMKVTALEHTFTLARGLIANDHGELPKMDNGLLIHKSAKGRGEHALILARVLVGPIARVQWKRGAKKETRVIGRDLVVT